MATRRRTTTPRRRRRSNGLNVNPEVARSIVGIVLLVLGAVTLIALALPGQGALTDWWRDSIAPWFETGRWFLPFLLLGAGWYVEWGPGKRPGSGWGMTLLGIGIAYVGFLGRVRGPRPDAGGGGARRRPDRPVRGGHPRAAAHEPRRVRRAAGNRHRRADARVQPPPATGREAGHRDREVGRRRGRGLDAARAGGGRTGPDDAGHERQRQRHRQEGRRGRRRGRREGRRGHDLVARPDRDLGRRGAATSRRSRRRFPARSRPRRRSPGARAAKGSPPPRRWSRIRRDRCGRSTT